MLDLGGHGSTVLFSGRSGRFDQGIGNFDGLGHWNLR
jgi:hypothetical protein